METQLEERSDLETQINYWHKRWRLGQRSWSVAHHGALFGSAVLSAAVGSIVQFSDGDVLGISIKPFATLASFFAASLAAIAGAGGFERKWRANRLSRGKLDVLRIDLGAPNPNLHNVREQLKAIMMRHDEEVVGMREEGVQQPSNAPG